MNRTYARSFASLASVLVALSFSISSAFDVWVLRQSTIPNIGALKPLAADHTWRFVQPRLGQGADAKFIEERISGLVSDSALLQEGWKKYAEKDADRALWQLAAWVTMLICSSALFALRANAKSK